MEFTYEDIFKKVTDFFKNSNYFNKNEYILDVEMMDYLFDNINNFEIPKGFTFFSNETDNPEVSDRIMAHLKGLPPEKNPLLPNSFPISVTDANPLVVQVIKNLGFTKRNEQLLASIKTQGATIITDDSDFLTKMYNLDFHGFMTSKQFIDLYNKTMK